MTIFDWDTLPESVAVIGTGVVGLELAQALHRLGVRVRLFGRSQRVGPLTDPPLQALAADIFAHELPLIAQARQLTLRREGDEVIVGTLGLDANPSRNASTAAGPASSSPAYRVPDHQVLASPTTPAPPHAVRSRSTRRGVYERAHFTWCRCSSTARPDGPRPTTGPCRMAL